MKNLLTNTFILLSLISFSQNTKEIEMVNVINELRTQPKSFISVVEDYISSQDSLLKNGSGINKIKIIGATVTKKTNNNEVYEAFIKTNIAEAKELIVFLNNQKPVKALLMSRELHEIATEQAVYMNSIGEVTHNGPNNQSIESRYKKYSVLSGENCGTGTTVNEMLLSFLLDSNSKNKGHRANLFFSKFTKIGVAKYNRYWVQDFGY